MRGLNQVELSAADGIIAPWLPLVFERFLQLDASRLDPGWRWLRVHIVKTFSQVLGSTVKSPASRRRNDFTVTLPRVYEGVGAVTPIRGDVPKPNRTYSSFAPSWCGSPGAAG
jgi:hypothetical protein